MAKRMENTHKIKHIEIRQLGFKDQCSCVGIYLYSNKPDFPNLLSILSANGSICNIKVFLV